MRSPKTPVPQRFHTTRPCPVKGCASTMAPIEYAHMTSAGPPVGVQFECGIGHRLARRVTHLWQILHEDPREALKENFARTLEDTAKKASGDGRLALTMIAQRVRASTPDGMPRLDRPEAIVEITGWSRERVERMLGTLLPGALGPNPDES